MAFVSKSTLSNDQLARDANDMPAFVLAVDARLKQQYPNYTFGIWVEFEGQGWVQWSVAAVSGAACGFRVIFRLPNRSPTAATLKVTRHSQIFGFLAGLSMVIAIVVGVVTALSGAGNVIAASLITLAGLGILSWFLSGTIASAIGKALPQEELQRIGQLVLEALG